MSKGEDFWGGLLLLVIIFAILGAATSGSEKTPPASEPDTQTWQQYSQSPPNSDVTEQLVNTQNLLFALSNDVSRLQAQNVDIQTALAIVNTQLMQAQREAREESRRQNIMAWVTTVAGAFLGFMFEKAWKWGRQFFSNKTNMPNTNEKEASQSHPHAIISSPSKPSVPNQPLQQNLNAPSVIRCPKCGKFMVTRSFTGKRTFVCSNTQCLHEISME